MAAPTPLATMCDRILVVEDNPDMRDSLREILEDGGAMVATAPGIAEAEALLAAGLRPSIFVIDLKLGWGETADAFITRLRDDPALAGIPIVVMSGAAHDLRRVDSKADRTLVKPFDVDHFFEVLNELCAR